MIEPRVSVILPCRNAADTLREAVDSIRAQTFKAWELIIVDDGSTDDSPDMARAFAREDARIRPLASSHEGIIGALRRGVAAAQGTYIARMDADDVSLSRRLAAQLAFMDAHPDLALCGTRVEMFGDGAGSGSLRYEGWLNALTTPEAVYRDRFIECPVAHPAFFMRRDAYDAVGGYEDRGWAEDYDLVLRLIEAGYHVSNVSEVLLRWRHTANRLSRTDLRYSEAQFRATKRRYLTPYFDTGRTLYQWGAGEVGKRWLREWERASRPVAVVDINPRKIGREIHGTPVVAPEDLPEPGKALVLVAVGAPGAREEIRAWCAPRGYVETRDYWFIA